jgi:6-phosphogluconolactonase (cycloisomerase 2 family)
MNGMTDKNLLQTWSRRSFLKNTAALAVAQSGFAATQNSAGGSKDGKTQAYVGTYTSAVDGDAHGEGIYLLEMNPTNGELSQPTLVAKTQNPSWVSIHPSRKYLYAINEIAYFNGSNGSVTAFAMDETSGSLTALNTIGSAGAGPAHMSIDASGRFVFVANYIGGSIAVLPILAGGSLGSAVDMHQDNGSVGVKHATDAPRGSFAISGHDVPHAHMIAPDPQNRFVLSTDLGQDRIYVYRFTSTTGKLTPSDGTPVVSLPSGDGPRHFAFHPNGHWFYSLQEEASTIAFFHYDPDAGALTVQQTISALPAAFSGSSFASEIQVSPDGRFLYSANRLHDSISVCSIAANGTLKLIGETSTRGDYPRHCRIDPTGNFLCSCNQRSDCITSFRIDRNTGLLTFTGRYTPIASPAIITFLR